MFLLTTYVNHEYLILIKLFKLILLFMLLLFIFICECFFYLFVFDLLRSFFIGLNVVFNANFDDDNFF